MKFLLDIVLTLKKIICTCKIKDSIVNVLNTHTPFGLKYNRRLFSIIDVFNLNLDQVYILLTTVYLVYNCRVGSLLNESYHSFRKEKKEREKKEEFFM